MPAVITNLGLTLDGNEAFSVLSGSWIGTGLMVYGITVNLDICNVYRPSYIEQFLILRQCIIKYVTVNVMISSAYVQWVATVGRKEENDQDECSLRWLEDTQMLLLVWKNWKLRWGTSGRCERWGALLFASRSLSILSILLPGLLDLVGQLPANGSKSQKQNLLIWLYRIF